MTQNQTTENFIFNSSTKIQSWRKKYCICWWGLYLQ